MQVQTVNNDEESVEVTIKLGVEPQLDFHNWTDDEFDNWLDSMDWAQDCDPLGTPEQQLNAALREEATIMNDDDYWNQLILDGVVSYEDYLYLDY